MQEFVAFVLELKASLLGVYLEDEGSVTLAASSLWIIFLHAD